jgi:hypothetical protein
VNDKTIEEILTRKATLARDRLLAVVDELDRKRHNLAHPMKLVSRQMPEPISLAALGAAALIAIGAVGYVVAKLNKRKERKMRRTLPKLFQRTPPPPSFLEDVGSRTSRALLTFGLVEAGKYVMKRAVSSVPPPQAGF